MSRTPSTDLFDLVKSLTKSEKRFFKLYASRRTGGEKNNYVVLFDAIDRQHAYDEELLLRQTPALRSTDFRSMKSYLYELILKSLRLGSGSPVPKVVHLIEYAQILIGKKLYRQATRLLEKGRKQARTEGHLVYGLDILLNLNSLKVRLEETNSLERHRELHEETMRVLDLLRENVRYYDLFMRIHYMQLQVSRVHNGEERKRLAGILDDPLLRDDARPMTFFGRMQFHEVRLRGCHLLQDEVGTYEQIRKKVELFDEYPDEREKQWYEYVYACGTFLTMCLKLGRYDEFDERFARLKGFDVPDHSCRVDLLVNLYYAELAALIKRGKFTNRADRMEEIERFLEEYREQIEVSTLLSFRTGFAVLRLIVGEFREGLAWTGRVIGFPHIDKYGRFEENARLVNLICWFELGDDRGLDSAIRSTYRFLKRKDWLQDHQVVLLRFLRRLPDIADRKELRERFVLFRRELQEVEAEGKEGMLRGIYQFDLLLWLRSKIEGRPFAELLYGEDIEPVDGRSRVGADVDEMPEMEGTG